MGPRLTVSIQTVERSTLGTAGFNLDIAIVARIKPSAEPAMIMMRRLRFFAATPMRGTSIEERLGANPAGRTIRSSFIFRSGITVQSNLTECSTKLTKSRRRTEQWRCGDKDHRDEEKCFANKIAASLFFKILAANISKRRHRRFCATAAIIAE